MIPILMEACIQSDQNISWIQSLDNQSFSWVLCSQIGDADGSGLRRCDTVSLDEPFTALQGTYCLSVFEGQAVRNTGPAVEGNTVLQNVGNHAADDKGLQPGHKSPIQKALPPKALIQKRKPPPNQQQQTRQCRQPSRQKIT